MGRGKKRRVGAPSTRSPSEQFTEELEAFRTDVETSLQFLYAYLTVHAVARDKKAVYRAINGSQLFWNTTLGALQTATFIALGRMFDQDSAHNVDRLLRVAQDHRSLFSKGELRLRKQIQTRLNQHELNDYIKRARAASVGDVRRWRAQVKALRKVYEARYRALRHEVFAHNIVTDASVLFAQTNIRELQRLLLKLRALHDELRELFDNGLRYRKGPGRYSILLSMAFCAFFSSSAAATPGRFIAASSFDCLP